MATKKRAPKWTPKAGEDAFYNGDGSAVNRTGRRVRVLAEASGHRTIVEAIGKEGTPVRLTVKTANLWPPAPDLFG